MCFRYVTLLLGLALINCSVAQSQELGGSSGLVQLRSSYDVEQTTERLQIALQNAGMTLFGVVDHAAGATSVGLALPATRVVIFGNPKVGTPLMQCAPTVAIDLPMKALIYEDAEGSVWYAYNAPAYLKARHNLVGCDEVLNRVGGALAKFAAAATAGA